jgi:O-antigen/teichoic acid export membrane protein
MLLFLMAALPLMLLGPEVVRVLYGRAYYAASGLLPWLALRLFFSNFGIARSMFITNDRLFRFALSSAAAGAVTNVAMNLVLVPRWGIMGAIVSSLTSFAVTTFALDAFDRRARPNFKLMISAVVMPWRPLPVQEAGGI